MHLSKTLLITVICSLLTGFLIEAANIEKIQIFTTLNKKPVLNQQTNIDMEVYYLDEGQKVLDDLNKELVEKTKGMSREEKLKVYESIKFRDDKGKLLPFAEKMFKSDTGKGLAVQYDIKKVPAVVFNEGLAVIYGDIALASCLKRFNDWVKK